MAIDEAQIKQNEFEEKLDILKLMQQRSLNMWVKRKSF